MLAADQQLSAARDEIARVRARVLACGPLGTWAGGVFTWTGAAEVVPAGAGLSSPPASPSRSAAPAASPSSPVPRGAATPATPTTPSAAERDKDVRIKDLQARVRQLQQLVSEHGDKLTAANDAHDRGAGRSYVWYRMVHPKHICVSLPLSLSCSLRG